MLFRKSWLLSSALAAALPLSTHAGSVTDDFLVTITITGACTVAATDLAFGSNAGDIGALGVSGTSTITANCTIGAPYSIGLNAGTGSGATVAVRKMTLVGGAGETVDYSLYTDALHANVWNNSCTTLPGVSVNCGNSVGLGLDQNFTVYGLAPAQTGLTVGDYEDTITATLTF